MSISADIPWYSYIQGRYRLPMLLVLEEISRLRKLQDTFVVAGGLSLLMWGRLKHQVLWDVDLLFRDKFSIFKFLSLAKDPKLDIVSLDAGFSDSETIISFHTSWGFQARWINVDYLTRSKWYYFHKETIDQRGDFEEEIELEGRKIHIKLPVAYPWDMFIEKSLSPRLEQDLSTSNDLSYDLRHVFILFEQERENPEFWSYLRQKAERFSLLSELKERLLLIFRERERVGYGQVQIEDSLIRLISKWEE
ncbi:MAG: hypothetical protein QHH30_03800 [candidate division NC10 bacterium]|nr:hypothetical protein [candidate division NC10 bacterium]